MNAQREQAPVPYHRAAQFGGARSATQTYDRIQELLNRHPDCALSAHRTLANTAWHVAVTGRRPADELDRQIATILAAGEPTVLPAAVLALLQQWPRV